MTSYIHGEALHVIFATTLATPSTTRLQNGLQNETNKSKCGHRQSRRLFVIQHVAIPRSLNYLTLYDEARVSHIPCSPVHIDFGYAFGTATAVLPIPELVPFRATAGPARYRTPRHMMPSKRALKMRVNDVADNMTKCVKPLRHLATSSTKSSKCSVLIGRAGTKSD
jgi:hypothetical protein